MLGVLTARTRWRDRGASSAEGQPCVESVLRTQLDAEPHRSARCATARWCIADLYGIDFAVPREPPLRGLPPDMRL
jgi:hypothetical protein